MTEALLPHGIHSSNNPIPVPVPEGLDMSEATLAKLSRAQLQKVAKAHKVRANMKSAVIITELVKLYKVVPLLQGEESEKPSRKKSRTTGEGPPAGPSRRTIDPPMDTSFDHPIIQDDPPTSILILAAVTPVKAAGNAAGIAPQNLAEKSPSLSPLLLESPNGHPAAEDNSSDSGGSYLSYGSPSQQRCYKSSVSTRAGTPPPEEPQMLDRAVNIMKQITTDDQRVLAQAAALRQRAAGLKEQAENVRDVVRAERGRRVRLEAYFAYWREIVPTWPKDWIYEEGEEDQIRTERVLKAMTPTLPSTDPKGPPTLSFDGRDAPDSHRELRRRQLQPRQEARRQGNGTAPPPAEGEQAGGHSIRLPSLQLATKGRVAKRKHCA